MCFGNKFQLPSCHNSTQELAPHAAWLHFCHLHAPPPKTATTKKWRGEVTFWRIKNTANGVHFRRGRAVQVLQHHHVRNSDSRLELSKLKK